MKRMTLVFLMSMSTAIFAQSAGDIPAEEMVSYPTDNDLQPTQPADPEEVASAAPTNQARPAEQEVQQAEMVDSEPSPRAPILVVSDMSFQAKVEPLADGAHTLDFFIYDSNVGGNLLDSVLNVGVTSTGGVISTTFAPDLSIFDGGRRYLAFTIDDVDDTPLGTEPRTLMAAVPYAARVDYVGSDELDDNIALGAAGSSGSAVAISSAGATIAEMSAVNGGFRTWQSDGDLANWLFSFSWGQLLQYDSSGTNTVQLNANSTLGGELRLYNDTGSQRVDLQADLNGGRLDLLGAVGGTNLSLGGESGFVVAEDFYGLGTVGGSLTGSFSNLAQGAQLFTYDEIGTLTAWMGSSGSTGGFLNLYAADGVTRCFADGDSGGAGFIGVRTSTGTITTVSIDGDDGDGGARLTLREGDNSESYRLDANAGEGGAGMLLFDGNGATGIELDAVDNGHPVIRLFPSGGGTAAIDIDASEGATQAGGQILVRNASNVTTIEIDGDWGGTGFGRVRSSAIEVTGADLSENFDVAESPKPGTVVSIDPGNQGRLVTCNKPYDRLVAGIVSGAGSIRTGLIMGQEGSVGHGETPVALSGRVWCFASPENGPVHPGDFLTTSSTPGHCMKVRHMDLAQGAIIGKAMTSIENGMVLVLVNLQ